MRTAVVRLTYDEIMALVQAQSQVAAGITVTQGWTAKQARALHSARTKLDRVRLTAFKDLERILEQEVSQ